MKVILALGNPGTRYAATRHNIGWIVADAVAQHLGIGFDAGRGEYYEARGEVRGTQFVLAKPTTYMNNSGIAAAQILERYGVSPADMLALVDELQFPTGRIQLKPSGSSGGHNGTESLIYHLDTNQFPRLRCGVGDNFAQGEMVDYVLAPFGAEESDLVREMIIAARDAVLLWITEGTARAMNIINARRREAAPDAESEQRTEGTDGAPS